MTSSLASIDTWIFDLDNTLYPASNNLFAHIDARMTEFIANLLTIDPLEARRLQKGYFFEHGTTLSGLIAHHAVDPDEFLSYVHDIEMDVLEEDAPLVALIARLPGRKVVFTNGDAPYALRVLDRLGLSKSFEAIHDIRAMGLVPKPAPDAYRSLCDTLSIDPTSALFVDDMARNLKPAKQIGMTTVWVDNGSEQSVDPGRDHIDYVTTDIKTWLDGIMERI